ncbi:plasmid encoded RepA protein [Corynebacterium glutamicum]|nr:plasmid encoded RepA protein [Corynebacterium glutamicum]
MDNHSTNSEAFLNARNELELMAAEAEAGQLIDPYTFTSRTLIQATFPHSSKVGDKIKLVNGNVEVTMFSPNGLPYGVYPRLIMCWLTSEAINRKKLPVDEARTIPLGDSLASFMREVGMSTMSGGKDGNIARLRKQMAALFSTFISVKTVGTTAIEDMPRSFHQIENTLIADSAMLWWDPKSPEQISIQESTVTLSKNFYLDLVGSAVPLNNRILKEIRRSPMALDVYCWLTYRLSYHTGFTTVTWDQLRQQFGAGYPNDAQGKRNFKKKLTIALDKVLDAWPTKSAVVTKYGILLKQGEPSVPKKVQVELRKKYDGSAPF